MRYDEIFEARFPRKPSPEALAKAEGDGFDVGKLWFHGTRRRFDGFRLSKENGIDELGPGVYLTSVKWLANTWAKEKGFIVIAVVRKGPMFDLDSKLDDAAMAMLRKGYVELNLTKWPSPIPNENYAAEVEEGFERVWKETRHKQGLMNLCLSSAGYVGAHKRSSQIQGQIVVFKPEDVMIVAREGGQDYMSPS